MISSIYPLRAPLVADQQLDFMLLVTALSAQQFSQFWINFPVHLASPYSIRMSTRLLGEIVKSFTEVKLIEYTAFPYLLHCRILSGQAWFHLHKSTLTTPSNFIVFYLPGNGCQDYLLMTFPKIKVELWPVVSLSLPSCLVKDGNDICFLSVLRKLPWSLWPFIWP